MQCKHMGTTMQACTLCKAQAHLDRLRTVHCHPSNREWVAAEPDGVNCEHLDKECINCNSKELQHFEMEYSYEHHCLQCDFVWLRFQDNGERNEMGFYCKDFPLDKYQHDDVA